MDIFSEAIGRVVRMAVLFYAGIPCANWLNLDKFTHNIIPACLALDARSLQDISRQVQIRQLL